MRLVRALIVVLIGVTVSGIPELAAEQGRGRGGGIGPPRGGTGGRRGAPAGGRAAAMASAAAGRIETRSYLFSDTNEELEYAVFVSTKVNRDKKSPLLIALHGLGVPPTAWLRLIADAAQNAGYIVAAPTGYNLQGWYGANGPSSGRGSPANLGELSEKDVLNVLELMRKEFNVDERRIYLAGQSMGGAGALFLGVKHRDIWAAVAASAPAVRTRWQTPADLEPARSLPFMLIHGDQDRAVPVEQTREWVAKMNELKMTHEYHEIRGAGHGDAIVQGARRMFAFFNKHLKTP